MEALRLAKLSNELYIVILILCRTLFLPLEILFEIEEVLTWKEGCIHILKLVLNIRLIELDVVIDSDK